MSKWILYFVVAVTLISCGAGRYSSVSNSEKQSLSKAVKSLEKNAADSAARKNVITLYTNATNRHLDQINLYETLSEAGKWEKILKEYQALNELSTIINSSSRASVLVNAPAYDAQINKVREQAAAAFYALGESLLDGSDKKSSRQAWDAYRRANDFIPGYMDVKQKIDAAYENSVLNVVINPVTDESYYYSSIGSNRFGNSFNNDYLQRNLVRDLGGDFSKNSLARFYTGRDARRNKIDVNWVIDLTWTRLDIPRPLSTNDSRVLSRRIEIGKDTSGRPVYQNVSATVYVTRQYFTATGELESRITDMATRNQVDVNRYVSQVDWQQEYASYTGDSRALDSHYLNLVANSRYQRLPDKEAILNELYEKIYPQVRSGIYNEVRR